MRFSRSPLSLGTGSEPPLLLLLPPSKPPSRKSTTMVGPTTLESLATLSPPHTNLGFGRWASPKRAKTKRVFCRAPRSKNSSACRVAFACCLGRSGRQKREHGGRERDLITFLEEERRNPTISQQIRGKKARVLF